jgi:hypothetical protein
MNTKNGFFDEGESYLNGTFPFITFQNLYGCREQPAKDQPGNAQSKYRVKDGDN